MSLGRALAPTPTPEEAKLVIACVTKIEKLMNWVKLLHIAPEHEFHSLEESLARCATNQEVKNCRAPR